jgi:nicotinic acid mononucleotide adenylyltransferase
MAYLVGADTFNAIVDEKYIDTSDPNFFKDFERSNQMQSGIFMVISRDGYDLVKNEYTDKIHYSVVDPEYPEVSSSAVRGGELKYVNDRVRRYIEEHELYR